MENGLPAINKRVKDVVNHYANGNVSKFVQILNQHGEQISQQKFNRLFNIDTRTKKYPGIPSSVTTAITNTFKEVNANWLLTGEGEMLNHPGRPAPGDRMNPMRAFMLALADDYVRWRISIEFPNIDDEETVEKLVKQRKQEIVTKTNLALGGLDQWPFQEQKD